MPKNGTQPGKRKAQACFNTEIQALKAMSSLLLHFSIYLVMQP